MTTILVNDVEHPADASLKTWGQLLATWDHRLATGGHVVTAARFDGVDEPTFRDPARTSQTLSGFELVEIESGALSRVIEVAVSEAARALDALGSAATRVAHRFLGHDLGTANRELQELAQGLRMFVTVVATAAMGLGLDLETGTTGFGTIDEMSRRLVEHVDALIAARDAEDWVMLADILQYEIEPALGAWRPVLLELRDLARRETPVPGSETTG